MSENKTVEPDVKQEPGTKAEQNVPKARLDEVITERNTLRDAIKTFEAKEENRKKAELEKNEQWQELNSTLQKELDSYKPFKEKYEVLDKAIREDALQKIPESKREKFSNLDTPILLDMAEEFQEKRENPPDKKGTIPKTELDIKNMSPEDKRKNWKDILESYRR